jgi:alkylation response protein AidB-like acyl-CoA dehydrogenase
MATLHPGSSGPGAALDRLLHSEGAAGGPFSPAALAELDRREAFPSDACRVLNTFGLHQYYVPTRHGGRLSSYPELMSLWRTVARRDLTVAIGHGKTLLGGACMWVAGEPAQAQALAGEILAGAAVSWGLTERNHGGDLLAGECAAARTAGGWRVDGEKWLINNATRGQMLCVLARTDPAGGPRGFSLVMVDKRRLPEHSYRFLPKERLHGIRGADISGIAFQAAEVPRDALIGEPGEGIEIVLKSLQLSRTACVAVSLGAADHALRLALEFAAERELYGRRLVEMPSVRRLLGEALASMLLAEAVALVAGRCIHALPAEMSVVSALAKAFVPTTIDETLARLGELLGSRAFMAELHAEGMFQKIERDHRLIAIFDGSTVVNRNALVNQFHGLARAYHKRRQDEAGLALAATLDGPLPDFDGGRLGLFSAGGCSVAQSLPGALARLREAAGPKLPPAALRLAEALGAAAEETVAAMAAYTPSARDVPAGAFALAERYELCFAGAACLQLWLRNAASAAQAPLWRDGLWLQACLAQILRKLDPGADSDGAIYDRLADGLAADGAGGSCLSLLAGGWAGRALQ